MMTLTPPSLPDLRSGELVSWLGTALKVKRLGDQDMMEFLRILPMPVEDFLNEWFESDALKGVLGANAVTGTFMGPKASGTVLTLLYQGVNAPDGSFRSSRFVQGGIGTLSEALAQAARQYGTTILTGEAVSCILIEEGRVVGIQLESGAQIRAPRVVSSADPIRTFFGLVGASHLEVRTVREVKNIRMRASLSRVNLALSRLPAFAQASEAGSAERLGGQIVICSSLNYLERAYDQAKYGGFSDKPMLSFTIPTVNDPSLAPGGKHVLCTNVYYTPYDLKQPGGWEVHRDHLLEVTLQTLECYAPGIRESVLHNQVLTPVDLEQQFGLTGGDIYHGQMGLDQLLISRPIPSSARYRAPLEGLYLCGAGSHPGGGITGAPGFNAAREILKDRS
jgi:phytoene dehydrogenase-like protein